MRERLYTREQIKIKNGDEHYVPNTIAGRWEYVVNDYRIFPFFLLFLSSDDDVQKALDDDKFFILARDEWPYA